MTGLGSLIVERRVITPSAAVGEPSGAGTGRSAIPHGRVRDLGRRLPRDAVPVAAGRSARGCWGGCTCVVRLLRQGAPVVRASTYAAADTARPIVRQAEGQPGVVDAAVPVQQLGLQRRVDLSLQVASVGSVPDRAARW